MKYSFRPSDKNPPKISKSANKNIRLRLMSSDKLRALPKLPASREQIRFSYDDRVTLKEVISRIIEGLKRLTGALGSVARRILRELRAFSAMAFGGLKQAIAKVAGIIKSKSERQRSISSLPVYLGAVCAGILVCTLSASYVLIGLFSGYVGRYDTVTVPSFIGKAPDGTDYDREIFDVRIEYENNSLVAEGTVISQKPPANAVRRIYGNGQRCDVTLTVSRADKIQIPSNLVGSVLRDAALKLKNCGLSYTVTEVYSDSAEAGRVISVYPAGLTEVAPDCTVNLTVSLGEKIQRVYVPSLLGLSEASARRAIEEAGLAVGKITYTHSDSPLGTVISQSPARDNEVQKGDAVSFTVSG